MGLGDGEVGDLLERAHVLMCQFKYAEALPFAQRAVEVAPESLKAWRELGSAYGYLGRVSDVEQAFEQALRLVTALEAAPEDEVSDDEIELELMKTWFARGHAENNADAYQLALHSFTMLAELDPDWGVPWLMCGVVLDNMGGFIDPKHFQEALAALDHALALGLSSLTDQRIAYEFKASELSHLGRTEEAKVCGQKAAELRRAEQAEQTEKVEQAGQTQGV